MKLFGLNISRKKRTGHVPALSRLIAPPGRRGTRSYDAAATNRHNANHWLYADARDADSIIFADLATLRNRCRYEQRNNCYASGIADTLSDDLVGTGPTPQIDSGDADFDKELEDKFALWCGHCDIRGEESFQGLLWQACGIEQCQSGEAFFVMQSAPSAEKKWPVINKNQVSLRLQLVESDRIATPGDLFGQAFVNDKIKNGIEVDENGRRLFYYILKKHPGSGSAGGGFGQYDKVPAAYVIHLYRSKRSGQTRGVPLFTPALGIFAQLRRFTLATLDAAEQAANIAGVMESEMNGTEEDVTVAGDEVEIPRNSLLGLPTGTKMAQLKAEHPAGTYKEFKQELLNEAARCISMPFNIAAANSSEYNYASGRLDHQSYFKSIKTARGWIEHKVLKRIFSAWYREALLLPGFFKGRAKKEIRIQWFWPGYEHVDPVKEAIAQKHRLANHTTTLAAEYASQGKDWEREIRQSKKETDLLQELGIISTNEAKKTMEDIARAVRSGVPIAVGEARSILGLEQEPPDGKLLRFNDQDVLQYHIESGVLTINEARAVLGLPKVKWGKDAVRKNGVSVINTSEEKTGFETEETENEREKEQK